VTKDVVRACADADVPVFVKQLGKDPRAKPVGRLLLRHPKGGDLGEWPKELRVRQWPAQEGETK